MNPNLTFICISRSVYKFLCLLAVLFLFNANGFSQVTCTGSPSTNALVSTSSTLCPGNSATLSLAITYSVTDILYSWYSSTTSSTTGYSSLSVGFTATLVTINLNMPTWFMAVATCTNSGSSTTLAPIEIIISNASTTLTANSATICENQSVNLTANSSSTLDWYSSPSSTTSIGTGTLFTTPILSAGIYTYFIQATNSCSTNLVRTPVSATVYPSPFIGINSGSICMGSGFTLTPSGANSYTFITGANIVNPLTNTSYSIIGSSTQGCISSNTAISSVIVNTLPPVSANSASATICYGNTTSIYGTGANSYLWSDGISDNSLFSPILTSSYSVTGTDGNGCQNNAVITITVNNLPLVAANSINSVICLGNTTTLYGSGASSYTWTNGVLNNVSFSPSITSVYNVIGTDANGCSNSAAISVTVNSLPPVTASISNSVVCFGNPTTLFGGGALTYTWSGNTTNNMAFNPSVTIVYTVTGTDANGCQNNAITSVTVNSLPAVFANATSTVGCIGYSTVLFGSGALTYTWSPNIANNSSLILPSSTNFTVTGTDVNGCEKSSSISIIVNPLPIVLANASNSAVCIGNTLSLSGSGAGTYTWAAGILNASPFTPTSTNTYYLSGTDPLTGCMNSDSVSVIVNPLPTVITSAITMSYCVGGGGQLIATGTANTYTWTGGLFNYVPYSFTTTTTQTVTGVIAATGCHYQSVITITVHPRPVVVAYITNSIICLGQLTTVYGSGADTYTWSGNIQAYNNVPFAPANWSTYFLAGTNTLTACTSTNLASISVTVNTIPTPTIAQSTSSVCAGGVVALTVTGPYSYTWTPIITNGQGFIPTATTIYTLILTNTLTGCTNTSGITSTVTVHPNPIVVPHVTNSVVCQGQSSTFYGSGADTYNWVAGAGIVQNNVPYFPYQSMSVLVFGTNTLTGCVSTNSLISVTVLSSPSPYIISSSTAVCIGSQITFTASGADTYTFSGGSGTITSGIPFTPTSTSVYSLSGTYTLTGCSTPTYWIATEIVVVNSLPLVSIVASSTAVCLGSTVSLSGAGVSIYQWSNGISNGVAFTPTVATTYSVIGVNATTGCSNTAVQSITLFPLPNVTASVSNSIICRGKTTTLSGAGANTYSWTGVLNNVAFSPTATATYTLTGTNILTGCQNTTLIAISVNPLPTVTANSTATRICEGEQVILFGNGADTYTWTNSVIDNVPFSPGITTTYSVSGTNIITGCTSTNNAVRTISVLPSPSLSVLQSDSLTCSGQAITLSAGGADIYSWSTFENTFSISVSPTITTQYTLSGTGANGCVNTITVTQIVSDCIGLQSNNFNKVSIVVYPNPNKGEFMIVSSETIQLFFTNELGEYSRTIYLTEANNYSIYINNLPSGIYFISGRSTNYGFFQKIIVTE